MSGTLLLYTMHKIEIDFRKVQDQNPFASSVIVFGKAVYKHRHTRRSVIEQLFTKLVDSEDYDASIRKRLIDWMINR